MKTSIRLCLLLLVFFLGFFLGTPLSGHASDAGSATEAIKKTVEQVLEVLGTDELQTPERKEERLKRLVDIISKRFDYEEMGKRTLSRNWKKLTPKQQEEFVELFRQFLTKSYAGNVDSYSGETIEYIKERNKGNFAEVQTKVISSKSTVPLDYRLLKKNQQWWIYDVIIDSVSLMKNYRGQFDRILKTSSFEDLLTKLRTKADQANQP